MRFVLITKKRKGIKMKKTYKTPAVKKIDFIYDEQVNADSSVRYCAMTVWWSSIIGVCDNPKPWYDDSLHLVPAQ